MPAQDAPNILLIMTDQHRWDYLGCYGADFVDTPNIDRLAASGLRFTNAFTNAPVCAPARIGLATGMHPARIGTLDNSSYLPGHLPTYYQRLRDCGYRVGCVGKLDLAKPDTYNGRYGDRPQVYRWGFTHPEECEGKMHAAQGEPTAPHGPYTHYLREKGRLETFWNDYQARARQGWVLGASHDSVLPTEDFEDCYIGRQAAQWIETIPDDFPWHLFVSFVGPHDPFDPPTEYAEQFRDAAMPGAIPKNRDGKPQWVLNRQKDFSTEELACIRRQYCALIKLIDDQVGTLLDALEARDVLDNTYIIFTSDHGEMLGDHGLVLKGCRFYEGLARVPLMISWRGRVQPRIHDELVELVDIAPTLYELAGMDVPPWVQGRSLASRICGGELNAPHREFVRAEHYAATNLADATHATMYRDRRWKLVVYHQKKLCELFDLENDPWEHNDLSQDPAYAELKWELLQRSYDATVYARPAQTDRYGPF